MTEQETFKKWMARVDKLCEEMVGVSIHDLPDVAFYDMWEDEEDPIAAVRAATYSILD